MEILFQTQKISYLAEKRCDELRQEQTGEIAVPEALPELGRVVDCFGAVLVRSRSVENGSVTVAGEIALGVLYVPADENGLETLRLALPFTVAKKLPTEEGTRLFYWGWLRSADARFVNARKLLVRAELCSELTLLTPAELELKQLSECPRGLICKTETYPLRLPLCAAEKEVRIADEVLLPEEGPGVDRLLKAQCSVSVAERRVLGERAIFQGELLLHVLGLSEDGEPVSWSGSVPFSQYAELDRSFEDDARLSVQPILEHVEIDTDGRPDSRRLLINVSFLAQLLVWGDTPVTLTRDAYCLEGVFEPEWQLCDLSPCLDALETGLRESIGTPPEAQRVLDCTPYRDRLAAAPGAETAEGEIGVNLLYYDADNRIRSRMLRKQISLPRRAEPNAAWSIRLEWNGAPELRAGEVSLPLKAVERYCQSAALRNLSGGTLEPGPAQERPSLIVCRASGDLWEIARENGSTVRSIQSANELEDSVLTEETLLLIPTGRGAAEEEVGE